MKNSTIKERLKSARNAIGKTMAELSGAFDVPERTISNYERGVSQPSVEYLNLLHTKFGINLNWLINGEGEMYVEEPAPLIQRESTAFVIPDNVIRIPFDEDVELSAGNGVINHNESLTDYILLAKKLFDELYFNIKATRGVKVRGRSMEPTTNDGDIAFIDHSQNILHDGELYAIFWNGGNMIKRLERMPRGCIRIISDNRADYPPKVIDLKEEHDFRIIGKAVYFINKAI